MNTNRFAAGIHSVQRIVGQQPQRVKRLLIDERSLNERLKSLVDIAADHEIAVQRVKRHRLDDMASGTAHQGVVAELAGSDIIDEAALRTLVEARLTADEPLLLLLLDRVQDPHNLGACLRSAEAAGALAVVVPAKESATLTPAARKIASGAAEVLPLARVSTLSSVLRWLSDYGVQRVATSDGAEQDLFGVNLSSRVAIVMGAEEHGIRPELARLCDTLVRIPMAGLVESLNVSVATGITLFEAVRQRRHALASEADQG